MKVHGIATATLVQLVEKINEWIGENTKLRKLIVDIKYATALDSAMKPIFTALIIYND